jgi:hypothetical protein
MRCWPLVIAAMREQRPSEVVPGALIKQTRSMCSFVTQRAQAWPA